MNKKSKPTYSAIVAIGKNNEIGIGNKLPWTIKSELKYFKDVTVGKVLIVGRTTYESLPPLKDRTLIVVSASTPYGYVDVKENVYWVQNLEEAKALAETLSSDEIIFIGGASIYTQAAGIITNLYLTVVDKTYPEADTYFDMLTYTDKFIKKALLKSVTEVSARDDEPKYTKLVYTKRTHPC